MRRREFIAGLGAAALPRVASAQQRDRVRHIGVLNSFIESDPLNTASLHETFQELSRLGWENGRNLQIDLQWANGSINRLEELANQLVGLKPDVLLSVGSTAAAALHRQTRAIPIVFVVVNDPVGWGFAASLARPGGNMTGFINFEDGLMGKLLTLLREAAPQINRVAAILNPETSPDRGAYYVGTFETVARRMALEPIIAEVRSETDLEHVIAALGNDHGGLIVIPNLFVYNNRGLIANLAIRSKTPTVLAGPDFASRGGLIDYGPDFPEMYRRAASYVDRILRGAQPSDLPIELPTKWHLVINLKTAQSLGLPVPNSLLVSADEVIE
jgi:putative tryptophan/tyrosine transport system substrate-binding protein